MPPGWRACIRQTTNKRRLADHGDDDDAGLQLELAHALGHFDAADAGHVHIDKRQVGLERFQQHQSALAIRCLANHVDVRLLLENQAKTGTHELVVVDKDDANHSLLPCDMCRHESGR